jgi:multidrug efflux pump subunit AcrA (membrane-fusion protein)
MSAFPASPQPAPDAPRLVTEPAPPPRSKTPIFFFLILLLAGAVWYFRPRQEKPARTPAVRTIKAAHGAIESILRIGGTITASRFANITVPVLQAPDTGRGLTLMHLVSSGKLVKEGEVLAEIDAQDMRDHLDDVEAGLVQAELDVKKLKSVQLAQMEALQQKLRSTRGDLLKAKEDLKSSEVRSAIVAEGFRLSVEEAQAAYDELSQEIPLMRQRQQAEMNVSLLALEQQMRHRNRHQHDIERCRIKSPIDGMVVLRTTNRNGELTQIQDGERVAPGQPVMRVVDPGSMQLDADVNQTEIELLHLGQQATLHFDAFPGIVLAGRVQAVGALAIGGRRMNYYIRRIPVRVAIAKQDTRVIPDLSASADVATSGPAEGLIVPREAVAETAGKNVVYVRQDGEFSPREVEIAGENNTHMAVTGGLHEGEEIAADAHSVTLP